MENSTDSIVELGNLAFSFLAYGKKVWVVTQEKFQSSYQDNLLTRGRFLAGVNSSNEGDTFEIANTGEIENTTKRLDLNGCH